MTKGLVNNTVVALVINGNDRLRTEIGIAEAEDLNIFCRCKMLEQCRDFTLAIEPMFKVESCDSVTFAQRIVAIIF